MTVREMAQAIGKEGLLRHTDGVQFRIRIVDARQSFDRTDYRIEPINGQGSFWVNSNRVTIQEEN